MSDKRAETLSAHLLYEAQRFLFYPARSSRTRAHLNVQASLDEGLRRLVEWRKTFAPQSDDVAASLVNEGPLLDELYSRELLREVPDIVRRTRALAPLTLKGVSGESFVYLREAANCFIFGLPQAAVALARAAVEQSIRRAATKRFGARLVSQEGLFDLLDQFAGRGQLLSAEKRKLAHAVRKAGDRVLHEEPTSSSDALSVLEAARVVVIELADKAG